MLQYHKTENNAVLGVGNALVDIMIALPDDAVIKEYSLPKGSMTLVENALSGAIYQATLPWHKTVTTGGSAANAIHALANLGASCGYIGKIGNDDPGAYFENEFRNQGIQPHLYYSQTASGKVMVMVTPDSERTLATCLGAAAELLPEYFVPDLFRPYSYVYVEGYLVQDYDLIRTIVKTASETGLSVAIDLSSYNIVAQNREFLRELISQYVDIVFANEEEAHAYTGLNPEEAVEKISEQCKLAIVKTGKSGSLVRTGNTTLKIEPVPAHAVDTTGAGDCYAAGFLYGLTRGLSLRQCGDIASLISSKVVETLGAKIPEPVWPELLSKVREIEEGR